MDKPLSKTADVGIPKNDFLVRKKVQCQCDYCKDFRMNGVWEKEKRWNKGRKIKK